MPISRLIAGHEHFVETFAKAESEYLRQLSADGQKPDTLIVSCSDSRVIPELITGASPGHLFVVRNVGNMVPPYATKNMTVGSALEYAIDYLGVQHVIVLGHYQCGAMAALRGLFGPGGKSSEGPLPETPLVTWLRYAEASYEEAVHKGVLDTDAWLDTLVEENVLQQLANVIEYPVVRSAVERGDVKLHAWSYSLEDTRLYFFDAQQRVFRSSESEPQTVGQVTIAEIEREDDVK
ncbi:MAG: carbonic anhydrase [Polyangiales bacterium]